MYSRGRQLSCVLTVYTVVFITSRTCLLRSPIHTHTHTHTHTHFGHTRRSVQPRQSVLLCGLPRCVAYDCRYCRQRFPFICPGTFATVSRQWVGAMCDAVNDTIWRPVIASLALHVDVCGLQSFIPCHRVFYTRALTFNFWRRRSLLPFIALQDELTALSLPVDSRQRDG